MNKAAYYSNIPKSKSLLTVFASTLAEIFYALFSL